MHILFLVPYPPNLIRVRPYNLIRGHAVTAATLSYRRSRCQTVVEFVRQKVPGT